MKVKKVFESTIWTNPKPVLYSRHSYFPFACELDDGTLLASHVVAEAFESVNCTTRVCISKDKGRTWTLLPVVYDKSNYPVPTSDSMKPTSLGGGKVLLFGYESFRADPESTVGNPETGGLLDDRMMMIRSFDNGKTWTLAEEVPCSWGHHVEASAPITVLKNGDWVTPITRPRVTAHGSLASIAATEPPPAETIVSSLSRVALGSTVLRRLPSS